MQTVLTIAGFDPSSGAGVTADLKVFSAHGLFGTACITALTVQSTLGVKSAHPIDSDILHKTLVCLDEDIRPAGVKIGMLANANIVNRISDYIEIVNVSNGDTVSASVVLDPVVCSSSGKALIDTVGLVAMQERLLPIVDWITPNRSELALLSGVEIRTHGDVPEACLALQQKTVRAGVIGPLGIIATGGHLDPPNDYMLTPEGAEHWFPGKHIETTASHGTGCAFSSAFLCSLVKGQSAYDACLAAKTYVTEALRTAVPVGKGTSSINHLGNLLKQKP